MQIGVDSLSWLDECVTKAKHNVVALAGSWMISART